MKGEKKESSYDEWKAGQREKESWILIKKKSEWSMLYKNSVIFHLGRD